MVALESVQQSCARDTEGSVLPRPRGPGPSEAADRGRAGQRVDLLSGAEQHLLGPELPEPEPLVDTADALAEGGAAERVVRSASDRDGTHTDESS